MVKLLTSSTTVFSGAKRLTQMLVSERETLRGKRDCIKPKPANKPPNIRISVARNSHIPILLVSNCCSFVAKWCWSVRIVMIVRGYRVRIVPVDWLR